MPNSNQTAKYHNPLFFVTTAEEKKYAKYREQPSPQNHLSPQTD